jgi:uncharacterized protein YdcH (DUF465 family)
MENTAQDEELKSHLLATDPQFRELAAHHEQWDRQLAEIEAKPHVTEADELEEGRLKKLKLQAKDRMNEILDGARQTSVQ